MAFSALARAKPRRLERESAPTLITPCIVCWGSIYFVQNHTLFSSYLASQSRSFGLFLHQISFTFCKLITSPVAITWRRWEADIEDNTIRLVEAPTPLTLDNSQNMNRYS